MNQDNECLQKRELQVRELENKLSKMENELEAQTVAHEVASHKAREEDVQLHSNYNQTVQKLVSIHFSRSLAKYFSSSILGMNASEVYS